MDMLGGLRDFWRFDGRVNRVRLLTTTMINQLLVWAPGMAVFFGLQFVGRWLTGATAGGLLAGLVVLLLAASYLACAGPIARRAHDLGWLATPVLVIFAISGLSVTTGLALLVFNINASDLMMAALRVIAAPGQVAFILLLILPGQTADNKFGPPPKQV